MAIERQAVQGLQRVQSTGAPRASMIQTRTASAGQVRQSSMLDDIMSVVGNASTVATQLMNTAVEEDKIRQYDRNLRGLMPSEDATTGGRRAHMLVNLQNRSNEITQRLQDDATRFDGTDEEWEEHVITNQRAMREEVALNYPELAGDKNTGKMITTTLMEQQPKVFAARAGAKLKQEHAERTNAIESRVLSMTDGISGDALVGTLHQLQREAVAMQITKPEFESMVVSMAAERAAVGDSSFIEATKHILDGNGVSLYSRNGKLMQAELQADRTATSLDQVGLYKMKSEIENGVLGGDMSWEEFLSSADAQNAQTGATAWSEAEITALYNKKAKMSASSGKDDEFMRALSSEGIAGLQDFSAKERKEGAETLRTRSNELAEAEIARTGATGQRAEAIKGQFEQQRYLLMAKNALQDPVAKERFDSLMMLSPEHLKDMKDEPQEMQTLLRMQGSLPVDGIRKVMGDDAAAFVDNYSRALRMQMNPGQAIQYAQGASQKGKRLGSEKVKRLNKISTDVTKSVAEGAWGWGDNMGEVGRGLVEQEASEMAFGMAAAGYSEEAIEANMEKYLSSEYTQTQAGFMKAGVMVKGAKDNGSIAKSLGGINSADVGIALKQYMTNNEEAFLDNAPGMTKDDLYVDINEDKGTFVVRGGMQRMPVSAVMPLSELKGNDLLKQYYGEAEAKRNKEVEEAKQSGYGDAMQENYRAQERYKKVDTTAGTIGKRGIADFIMSPAFASGDKLPGNFEFGYEKNNEDFYGYVAKQENPSNVGFNRVAGTYEPYRDAHGESIGFGHFITDTERKNGYIMIDGEKIPFKPGESQLSPKMAQRLLRQDVKSHVPNTSEWKTPFEHMHPAQQRGIMDLTYNLGKGGIKNAPKADEAFKSGRVTDGFLHMLGTASTEGKRSPGLLVRRAEAYNMANATSGIPKISQVETNSDGSMRVKFDGEMPSAFTKDFAGKIGNDGWLTVYGHKKGSLVKGARPGVVNLK
ncbi:lysozyme domain-containing protein [Lelliottia phage phD2B]|uniref:Putative lysozyme domain containing protein n=1 Tax=Lelliottia phage phD2B TaxID=1542498 RepID=A0A088FWN7_9CAUD|nr:lysozyme domain-containing protein [Lelliottia phage phD2B]AIM51262.1 putative lysozyme domain containing protein [Lelliottia phage phD2B]